MAHYPTYAELRGMSTKDLMRAHDSQNELGSVSMRLDFYLEEIARRDLEEQSQKMLTMTEDMRNMTAEIRGWT